VSLVRGNPKGLQAKSSPEYSERGSRSPDPQTKQLLLQQRDQLRCGFAVLSSNVPSCPDKT
jgi:hypothetical protein